MKEPFLSNIKKVLGEKWTSDLERIFTVAILYVLDTLVAQTTRTGEESSSESIPSLL